MNNNFLLTEEIIWEYVDGLLAADDRARVEAYLRQHPEWEAKVAAVKADKRKLFAHQLEMPDRRFSDRVMAAWASEQIDAKAAQAGPAGRDWIIRTIAIVFSAFVIAPVVVLIIMALNSAPLELPQINLPEIEPVRWSSIWSNNAVQIGLLSLFSLIFLKFADQFFHKRIVTL